MGYSDMKNSIIVKHANLITCELTEISKEDMIGCCERLLLLQKRIHVDFLNVNNLMRVQIRDAPTIIEIKEPLVNINVGYLERLVDEGVLSLETAYIIFLLKWVCYLAQCPSETVKFLDDLSNAILNRYRGDQTKLPAIEEFSL